MKPTILVIFGITGDLSKRYLLPSLYHLVQQNLIDQNTEVIGITRGGTKEDEILATVEECITKIDGSCDQAVMDKLRQHISVRHMDVTLPEAFDQLRTDLDSLEASKNMHMNRLFYLSIPPTVAMPIITMLGDHGLNQGCMHDPQSSRILLEKPFGFNYDSAVEQIGQTAKYFTEEQVFRIDHYLAKETVQNILAFRFSNPIFTPLWNAHYVDYIEVLANESLGIEGRVNFYEQTGALRDLMQSHLLQILALVTMEQPYALTSEKIHDNKLQLMKAMAPLHKNELAATAVRGQYEGYKTEVANEASAVETYVAIKMFIETERWLGVPMIVRTGKALTEKRSEVNVVFKRTPNVPHHNVLTFRLQPNESLALSLRVKRPGFDDMIDPVEMEFKYNKAFEGTFTPTAYERVFVDALRGDHTLFATAQEILESWRVVQPLMDAWAQSAGDLQVYQKGSLGPDIRSLFPQD